MAHERRLNLGIALNAIFKAASASILAVCVAAIGIKIALGAGYIEPTPGQSPHGGYSSTSNRCKVCHAVHLATGSFRLLRDNSASTECDYCHGTSGVANTKPITLTENGHGLPSGTSGTIYAPDDLADTSTPSAARFSIDAAAWGCASCHSVHNANTIQLVDVGGGNTTKLLKKYPNPNKTQASNYTDYDPSSTNQRLSNWCSACHNANIGLHTTAKNYSASTYYYGHDASASGGANSSATYGNPASWNVAPGDGVNDGPKCYQCHRADGNDSTPDFPHSGPAPSLLATGTVSGGGTPQLDNACLSCHAASNLP